MDTRLASLKTCENDEMQNIFLSEMNQLLRPAHFLTGSHDQAAACFLEAWDACKNRFPAINNDPRGIAKKSIINAAIRRIAPEVHRSASTVEGDIPVYTGDHRNERPNVLNAKMFQQKLVSLDTFGRATLVLRLYEGLSSEQAAKLLQTSPSTLEMGYQLALRALIGQLPISTALPERSAVAS